MSFAARKHSSISTWSTKSEVNEIYVTTKYARGYLLKLSVKGGAYNQSIAKAATPK